MRRGGLECRSVYLLGSVEALTVVRFRNERQRWTCCVAAVRGPPPVLGLQGGLQDHARWQNKPTKSYGIMVAGVLAFSVVLGGLYVGMQSLGAEWMQQFDGRAFQYILIALLFGGVYGWYWWSRRKKITVFVTSDDLSVSTRPGDVYSFDDAKLGTWGVTGGSTMGAALHLQSGQNRFILGGRDRR